MNTQAKRRKEKKMQPEVMLFMFGMILITIKAVLMTIDYWKEHDE